MPPTYTPEDDDGSRSLNRTEEIVALLKKQITLHEYFPGDALPKEEALAQYFSVSRACIRESLGILKAQGYLESRRGKRGGTFVTNVLDSSRMDDLYGELVLMGQMKIKDLLNARLLIEPEAARAAALNGKQETIQPLVDCLQLCDRATTRETTLQYHIDFHNGIGQLSGNPFYAISIRSFMKFTQLFMKAVGDSHPDIHDARDHELILYAIENRDPGLAFERMYVHNSKTKENMIMLEKMFRESTLVKL